jgi:hypothetical protein
MTAEESRAEFDRINRETKAEMERQDREHKERMDALKAKN